MVQRYQVTLATVIFLLVGFHVYGDPPRTCLTCRSLLPSTLINVESKQSLGITRYAQLYSFCLFFSAQKDS